MPSPLTTGTAPNAVAINPVTNTIYVVDQSSNLLTVINGATNTTSLIPVGQDPYDVAVNPATDMVYVPNYGSNTVSVINGANNTVVATIPVGAQPDAVAVNPNTNLVYVADGNDGDVYVINGANNSVTTHVNSGSSSLESIAINPVTNKIYVASVLSSTISVIDGATNTVTPINVFSFPMSIVVDSLRNKIYVNNDLTGQLVVIDGATNATTTVSVDASTSAPHTSALDPSINTIYVATVNDSSVIAVDGFTLSTTIQPAPGQPYGIAVDPGTHNLYVPGTLSPQTTVLSPDGNFGNASVPISITTAAPAGDTLTVALPNGAAGTPYITNNADPTLTASVTSAYATAPAYVSDASQTPANPVPTALYYSVDDMTGVWSQASLGCPSGTNPVTFNIPLANQTNGLHELYLYAAYGGEGGPHSGNGTGNSPEISNVQAFPYFVLSATTPSPQGSTTVLTSNVNPQNVNSPVTFTATVSPSVGNGTPSGTVTFYDAISGTPVSLGTYTLAGGSCSGAAAATLTTSFAVTGAHPITAVYSGNYTTSTGSLTEDIGNTLTATTAVPSTILTVFIAATPFTPVTATGGVIPLTYGVSPALPAGLTFNNSTGAVTGTPSVTSPLTTYAVTVNDSTGATASAPFSLTVGKQMTTTAVSATPPTLSAGQSVTLTATITPNVSGLPAVPTGVVNFYNGTTSLGSATVSNGVATLVISTLSAGPTTLVATYLGDSNFATSTGNLNETIGAALTATTLVPSTTLSVFSAATPFAPVVGSGGTAPLTYALTPALPPGLTFASATGTISGTPTVTSTAAIYTVTVKDLSGATATATFSLAVKPQPTVTSLSATASPVSAGQPVTLTATVSATVSGLPSSPTGTVTFYSGSINLGDATVSGGNAVLIVTTLTPGSTDTITATYSGDSNFSGSTSSSLQEVFSPSDFSLDVSSTSISIPSGDYHVLTAVLTPLGGFHDTVALSCQSLPAYAQCVFQPSSTSLAAGAQTVNLIVNTSQIFEFFNQASVRDQRRRASKTGSGIWLATFFLPLVLLSKRKVLALGRLSKVLVLMLSVAAMIALQGCSDRLPAKTAPGTYTVTVVASDTSTSLAHSVDIQLVVR